MKFLKEISLKKLVFATLGLFIIGLGASLFLYSGLGSDPNSVFIEAVGKKTGISYGNASFALNGILALVVYKLDKRYISIATILSLFIPGYTADFFMSIYRNFGLNNSFLPFQILYTGLSVIILSFGITLYMDQKIGVGPFDALPDILADKFGRSFSIMRRILDIIALTLGIILGGTFGFGTVFLSLTVGPLVGKFRKIIFEQKKEKIITEAEAEVWKHPH